MKFLCNSLFALALSTFLIFPALDGNAQKAKSSDKPTDAELEQFVEVDFALKDIRMERQKKAMQAIKNSSLGVKGYRKASTAQNDANKELSEEKQKEYEAVRKKVKSIHAKYRKKERKKMKEMGMKPAQYQEIAGMKRDKEVRERLQRIKEEKMDEAQKKGGN